MVEIIPGKLKTTLIHIHSTDTNSDESKPSINMRKKELRSTYIWAGDGFLSGLPLMFAGVYLLFYYQ